MKASLPSAIERGVPPSSQSQQEDVADGFSVSQDHAKREGQKRVLAFRNRTFNSSPFGRAFFELLRRLALSCLLNGFMMFLLTEGDLSRIDRCTGTLETDK